MSISINHIDIRFLSSLPLTTRRPSFLAANYHEDIASPSIGEEPDILLGGKVDAEMLADLVEARRLADLEHSRTASYA